MVNEKTIEGLSLEIAFRQGKMIESEKKVTALQAEIKALNQEIETLLAAQRICNPDQITPESKDCVNDSDKYREMGLTGAIIEAVSSGPSSGMTVREITEELRKGGIQAKTKDLYNSVYSIAMGLVTQKRFGQHQRLDKRVFTKLNV